jgi:hypothetical protein
VEVDFATSLATYCVNGICSATDELHRENETTAGGILQLVFTRSNTDDQTGPSRSLGLDLLPSAGAIEMDLAVEAQAGGMLMLFGAPPGIPGTYRIVSITHSATRSGGATTSFGLKQPAGGAGTDGRKVG